jgi:hypothetical protein
VDHAQRIELLQRQIGEGNYGEPGDFQGWRERTRASLRAVFPKDDHWVDRFEDIRYTPMIWAGGTPDSYFDKVRAGGVRTAIAVLEGAIHQAKWKPDSQPNST